MAATENKDILRQWIEEFWHKGDSALLKERIAPNYVGHFGRDVVQGPDGFAEFAKVYRTAFPDLHFTIEDVITHGDQVVWRYTARGTHRGELMGILPTGKSVTVTGIIISHFREGRFVEDWGNYDQFGMLQQLGAIAAKP